ncbi:hypothetical protein SAMN06298214_1045 [Bacteroidales bacterium WCE2004]|nr:hypothetical protein SAMN06298214_1045 [Bacteroidales bacterium WCE2004]
MRRRSLFVLLLALVLVSTGCEEMRLRSQVKKLMASTVVLPEKVVRIDGREVYPMPDSLREKAKLIVYVDSSSCVPCRISEMPVYGRIISEAASFQVEVVILLANRSFSRIPLAQYVADRNLGIPMYVDEDNTFLTLNPAAARDSRLHSFLVNRQGTPVLVGDPVLSPGIAELFRQVLQRGI